MNHESSASRAALAGRAVACLRYDHHDQNHLDRSLRRWVRTIRRVDSVQQIVQRTEGNPGAGAVAGGLVGGLVFGGGRGPAAVAGAVGGAAVGAAASQGSSEQRTYQVVVRFDDGGYGEFVYAGYSPFGPGERVVVTPGGLERAG